MNRSVPALSAWKNPKMVFWGDFSRTNMIAAMVMSIIICILVSIPFSLTWIALDLYVIQGTPDCYGNCHIDFTDMLAISIPMSLVLFPIVAFLLYISWEIHEYTYDRYRHGAMLTVTGFIFDFLFKNMQILEITKSVGNRPIYSSRTFFETETNYDERMKWIENNCKDRWYKKSIIISRLNEDSSWNEYEMVLMSKNDAIMFKMSI